MKVIKNYSELSAILLRENSQWQQIIYDRIGIIVSLDQYGGSLFSLCGSIDFDSEDEYAWKKGEDCSSYCNINCINDLVDYITSMDGYCDYLTDVSYGRFSKSDLFWAANACLIKLANNQKRSDGTLYQDWTLFNIGPYVDNKTELHMALVDYDSVDFVIDIDSNTTLSDVLAKLSDEMCMITEDIADVPQYKVSDILSYSIPKDFFELKSKFTYCH